MPTRAGCDVTAVDLRHRADRSGSLLVLCCNAVPHRGGYLAGNRLMGGAVPWGILILAGLFEIGWAIGLKYSHGFTRFWPSLGTLVGMLVSIWLLSIAMRTLPAGTAYSVWVGIGAVGTALLGMVLLGEPVNAGRLASIALIVIGIVGLKLTTPG